MSNRRILGVILLGATLLAACTSSATTPVPSAGLPATAAPLSTPSSLPSLAATTPASPSPTPVATPDLSSINVTQAGNPPSSTGDLGSWVYIIGTAENLDSDRTARVSLRVVGVSADATVTLVHPIIWLRPGQTVDVEAVWAADPHAPYGSVGIEVAAVTMHDMTLATWDDGFSRMGGGCSEASPTVPPKCQATNGFTFPTGFEQYVILKLEADPATEYGGFVWVSSTATVVAPGATENLYIAGLPTWWKTTYEGMGDVEFWWSRGWSLGADQPGFGAAVQ